jgi:hypothetical protein
MAYFHKPGATDQNDNGHGDGSHRKREFSIHAGWGHQDVSPQYQQVGLLALTILPASLIRCDGIFLLQAVPNVDMGLQTAIEVVDAQAGVDDSDHNQDDSDDGEEGTELSSNLTQVPSRMMIDWSPRWGKKGCFYK